MNITSKQPSDGGDSLRKMIAEMLPGDPLDPNYPNAILPSELDNVDFDELLRVSQPLYKHEKKKSMKTTTRSRSFGHILLWTILPFMVLMLGVALTMIREEPPGPPTPVKPDPEISTTTK